MKKAFKWLDEHGVDYDFHDYKKIPPDNDVLKQAIEQHGWENVINRRGTTWRKLSNDEKSNINTGNAADLAFETPSIIKRPLITYNDSIILGFDMDKYEQAFIK